MCLILAAKSGTQKYSDFFLNSIRIGSVKNTDGIGYAFKKAKQKKIWISKGFKDVEKFIKVLKQRHLKDEDELIVHLRIGNRGAKTDEMNHPFVVSENSDVIVHNNEYTTLPIMTHNGTFYRYSDHNSNFSDTFFFIRDFMSLPEMLTFLKRDSILFAKTLEPILTTNKLAFIFPDETPLTILGDFKSIDGYYFSNDSYKDTRIVNCGGVETNWNRRHYEGEDDEYEVATSKHNHSQKSIPFSNSHYPSAINPIETPQQQVARLLAAGGHKVGDRTRDDKGYLSVDPKFDIVPPSAGKRTGLVPIHNNPSKSWLYPILGLVLYAPLKYTKNQFDRCIFNPAIFNYKHFTYYNPLGNIDLNISNREMYSIHQFEDKDPNGYKSSIHLLNVAEYDVNSIQGITDIIWMNNRDIVSNFHCQIKAEVRDAYFTVYRLVQKFSIPSKNLHSNISKLIRTSEAKDKVHSITYKNTPALSLLGLKIFANYIALSMFDYETAKGMFYKVQENSDDKSIDFRKALREINNVY